ncbi:P-loop containing nucleoside triphosphate hydrolase protein [Cladorrhinum sp. PSN259]|nr:P-loop containing nucleoside triphosphate hydrolase protein [Cladorrhinum sp. PSN259]
MLEGAGSVTLVDKLQGAPLTDIDIPQIIVVGDQLSGKSSVLEAISRLPFPRAAGTCTKFVTEIRLRFRKTPGLRVEIIPDPSTKSSQSLTKLYQFSQNVDPDASFEKLFREVADLLKTNDKFATRDMLVVEKFGPNLPLLTLVDLPGLIYNLNND